VASTSTKRYGVVTGAASGLGRALAVRLAKDGWHLLLTDLNTHGCEETHALVDQSGGSAQVEPLDVRDESQWLALHDKLQREWPRCDLIVNNAGVVASGAVQETPVADWDWLLSVNLRGVILGCHTFVPWLMENPQRSYVMNMASIAGLIAPGRMGAYNVAKAGVVSLSETLYTEVKRHNIGVTVVCPWFVKTNLLDTGRFADPKDKAGGALYMQQSRLTADTVADYAVRRMYRGKLYAVTGFPARQMWLMKRHFPQPFANFSEWIQRRFFEPRK
jgi:NAD(P)-dependent dehydrogenase (short-subunit alcohol dehydrogenase family)